LAPELFPAGFDGAALAVVDCSFISLRLILPAVDRVVRRGGRILALIKPQFEAGRRVVAQGRGVVRSEAVRAEVIDGLNAFVAARPEWRWLGVNPSTLLGPAGNQEYFVLIEKVA
jgi:23S rRNA (cytidine1920-2'-O)/16S rRNA (cytidine1409-2'-O)-methyltransferase